LKNILTSNLDYSRVDSLHLGNSFDLAQALMKCCCGGEFPSEKGKVQIIKTFEKKTRKIYGDSTARNKCFLIWS